MNDEAKIEIETKTGFKWAVDEDVLDDQELLDALVELDEHPSKYSGVISGFLGEDGKKALYEHVRNDNGRVKATLIWAEIADIIKQIGEKSSTAKN